jgi:hypothetical protein
MNGDQALAEIEKDFSGIQFLTLEDHFKVEVKNKMYLIQVFQSENSNAPWNTNVYVAEKGKWKYLADFPWRDEKTRESTIRTTLTFLEDWGG